MKWLCFIMIYCIAASTFAIEIYPKGCSPWVIHDATVLLSNEKPITLMMHNLSETDLWITHPNNGAGAQAGFTSLLQAGKWSALALNHTHTSFPIICIESKPGHEQRIPCAAVLAICQWPNSKLPESAGNIFWAGENMDLGPLKAYIERLGFILEAP